MSLFAGLALIALCIVTEAFFSGSEIAMVNADRVRLQTRRDDGDAGAARALDLLADEASLLATCLIGTNLTTVTGSAVAANLLLTHGVSDGWMATLVFTPLVLVFGEALPKTVMQHHADTVVPRVALPLSLARTLMAPFLVVVRLWNLALVKLTGGTVAGGYLTRRELLDLLETTEVGPIQAEDRRLIRGVLSLQDTDVEAIMTPLVRVVAVAEDATVGVAADIAIRTQHSRLPVYRGRIDNIVGEVHQTDLLFIADDAAPLAAHVRPVRFVPDSKPADALFAEMRDHGDHLVVVVDEYGGCVGLVTLEDLLEEFVGDIEDERDVRRPTMIKLDDGAWSLPGNAELDEVQTRTGVELPEGPYETVAGLVLANLGHIPAIGESVILGCGTLRVEDATDRAVRRVRLEPLVTAGNEPAHT